MDFEEPIKKAQAKATATTRFVVGDMNEFTTTERFDVIVFNESIYFLQDMLAGLQRYEQVLAPDGLVCISVHGQVRSHSCW